MRKHTHLALLCTVIVIGLLISPVMAVKAAPGEEIYRPFNKAQECPDIDGNLIVWEDDRNDEQERGVKDIFLATVEDIRSTKYGVSFGTRITDDPASQEKPSISGDYIVWQDNRNGNWDIYLYKRSTGKETRLTTDTGKQWLPIVCGHYVAWYDDSSGRTNVVLYDIASGKVKKVIDCNAQTVIPGPGTGFKPALSEKYVAWVESGEEKIRYYDIGTGEIGYVSQSGGLQSWPSLYGSHIAWEEIRNGNTDIYMTDLANPSGGVQRITSDTSYQVSAAISGTLIAWEDMRVPARSIYMYDLSPPSEELSVVDATDDRDEHLYPAVSGNTIVWQRGRGADSNLYIFIYKSEEPTEPILTTVEVTPTTATLEVDKTVTFTATMLDQSGNIMTGIPVAWTSSNETVGTITGSGIFSAFVAGTATVTATAGEVSGTAAVTVSTEAPVATSIVVTPTATTLAVDETEQFSATVRDQFGNIMTGIPVAWTSSNEMVGAIDADGTFAARAAGTATITASADNASASATVTVTTDEPVLDKIAVTPTSATLGINDTKQFTAAALDQFGSTMPEVPVTWSCSNTTVGTVGTDGVFTALAAGTATVTATAGEIAGTATVTVTAAEDPAEDPAEPVIASLRVTPPRATLAVGDDQKFIVTAYDQDNKVISAGEVTWTSSNETAGTIGADGILTALAEGTATVTATAGSASTEAIVTVIAADPAIAKIAVSPSAVILEVDDTRAFDVVAFDRFGNVVADAAITWTSSDPGVGTIDVCGLFTAICAGTTTLTATGDGAAGTATVTVTSDDPVLSRIVVTPPAITFNVGDAETFSATAYDQDGCVMPGMDIAWLSSDETVGTIGTDGRFAALTAGTTTLTASACGVTGTATVTVTDASSGVVISPSAVTLDVGDSRQFTATVPDLATAFGLEGNSSPGATVTWSCDDEVVGTIDRDGLFTAKAEGSATITATVDGGETGTAVVTVRSASPVPARIAVSPSDFTIAAGSTLSLTATVYDQYGYAMPEVKATWESSDETVGTIDACGLFTALEDGEVTLTASAGGISGSACVTVDPSLPVPTCVEVDPATATLAAGETREFVATVFDQCDNEMDWVRVAWSSSDPGVGSIDRAGLFAAYAGGSADVKARAGSAVGTAAVTVTGAPAPNPGDPGDSGGSTGSGWSDSGGDSSPTFDAGMRENLMRGETFTFSGITTSSVGSVAITAANTIPKLMVTVKETTPSAATAPPTGDIYEYVEITLSWVNPHDIERAVIVFTIPADWLEDHGMAPEDVRLMRCVGGVWQSLETEVAGEENGLYRFRATTPGFSTFAIAAAPENATVVVETNATTEGETNVTTNVTSGVTTEATTAQATTTPAAPLVYAPLLAPLAFFLWLRKKN